MFRTQALHEISLDCCTALVFSLRFLLKFKLAKGPKVKHGSECGFGV